MIRPSEQGFIVLAALVVPSEAAAPMASMEWRALREAWLRALGSLGISEEQARARASEARQRAIGQLISNPVTPSETPSGDRR
jgi:hypothetical protein